MGSNNVGDDPVWPGRLELLVVLMLSLVNTQSLAFDWSNYLGSVGGQ